MISQIIKLALLACLSLSVRASRLDLNAAKLKEITDEHIYADELEFDNMEIHSVAPDTFSAVKKTIVYIDLSYNKLTSLPYNVFSGLEKIKMIDVGSNNLESIDKRTFSGLSTLEEIKLKKCALKTIVQGTFDGLSNLKSLDLSLNFLVSLDTNLFSDLRSLVELELRFNKLERVDTSMFANTRMLKEISLDNNQLSTLDVDSINKLCLKRLSMEENKEPFYVKTVSKCLIVSKVAGGKKENKGNTASRTQVNGVAFFLAVVGVFVLY